MSGIGTRTWELLLRGRPFGSLLAVARQTAGLTQQELADAAGLTVTAVGMLERGERKPGLDTALRLCRALDKARVPAIARD